MASVPALDAAPGKLLRRPGAVSNARNSHPAHNRLLMAELLARVTRPGYYAWLDHITAASACTRPIRLYGEVAAVDGTIRHTEDMPDGLIYKACGNRRGAVCPPCSKVYQQDAYQVIKSGLVGGKGIPATVSQHPAVFATFTAPGFGTVHNHVVKHHTCGNRRRCDCRAEPCHARRGNPVCAHGNPQTCYARHENGDPLIGKPICLDCYDYDWHVVWNRYSGELWRRTKIALDRELAKLCRARGIARVVVRLDERTGRSVTKPAAQASTGKAAEFQARAVVHFHALVRLDGVDPADSGAIVPPPAALTTEDLERAIRAAATSTAFRTPAHPDALDGWRIAWGNQLDTRPITLSGNGEVTDGMVAGYLAKYATKSTEITGHSSTRINSDNVDTYADLTGGHVERLIAACWRLGRPIRSELARLQQARLLELLASLNGTLTSALDAARLRRQRDEATRQLDEATEAIPQPLVKRPRLSPPTSGAVRPWTCSGCGKISRFVQCQVCASPARDRARDVQRVLFLLLLSGEIESLDDRCDDHRYSGLRRWAHMLGFGGHFLTKSRRYSVTFRYLRDARVVFRRQEIELPTSEPDDVDHDGEETTLVINTLAFAGVGWHTSADAMLANTAAALAREHRQVVREEITHRFGSSPQPLDQEWRKQP